MNKKRLIAGKIVFAVVFLVTFYFLVVITNEYFDGSKYYWLWRILATLEIAALSLGCSIHLLRPNVNQFLFNSKVITVFSFLVLFLILEEIPNSPFKNPSHGTFPNMKSIIIFLNQIQIAKTLFSFLRQKMEKCVWFYNLSAILFGGLFFFHSFFNFELFSLRNDMNSFHDFYLRSSISAIVTGVISLIIILIKKPIWKSK